MSRMQGGLGAAALVAALVLPTRAHASVEYYHTDALGTPVAVTDEYRTVVERSEYEPYGALVNRPSEDGPGYTGHVSDAATGLSYMQQRYYDPQIGRFLSVDPVTADGSTGGNFNRYWYANNNPYRFTDPDGRLSDEIERQPKDWRSLGAHASNLSGAGAVYSTRSSGGGGRSNSRQQETTKRNAGKSSRTGFSAKGLLVGKPSVTASGMAAAGGGVQATKGLYNSDSSVGVVTPALGLTASVDVNLIRVSYQGGDVPTAPAEVKFGFDLTGHAILGGRISGGYTPPSTFEFAVDGGVGAGAGFRAFEVNAVFEED